MNRDEMLEREAESWAAFREVLGTVPAEVRSEEGVVPGWSTQDLVWHCAYWTDYTGSVLERIAGGEADPADTSAEEAEILSQGRSLEWDDMLARAEQARERMRAAASGLEELTPLAVEWIEGDTFEHYEDHSGQIQAFLTARG